MTFGAIMVRQNVGQFQWQVLLILSDASSRVCYDHLPMHAGRRCSQCSANIYTQLIFIILYRNYR